MSHLGRPKGKVVESPRLRPVAQRLSALLRRPRPCTGDALGHRHRGRGRAAEAGPDAPAREPALPRRGGGQRPRVREAARGLRRRLRQRRVRHRPPRARLDRRRREAPAGLRRPAHGARDPQPVAPARGPRAAVRGGHRRRQGLGQDRGARAPRIGSTRSSSAAAWPTPSSWRRATRWARACSSATASRTRSASSRAAETQGVELLLPTDVVVAKEVTRGAEHKIVPVHKIPNRWSAVDIGPGDARGLRGGAQDGEDGALERAPGRVRGAHVR